MQVIQISALLQRFGADHAYPKPAPEAIPAAKPLAELVHGVGRFESERQQAVRLQHAGRELFFDDAVAAAIVAAGGFVAGFLIGELWSRVKGARAEMIRTVIAATVVAVAVVLVLVV